MCAYVASDNRKDKASVVADVELEVTGKLKANGGLEVDGKDLGAFLEGKIATSLKPGG